MSPSLRVTKCQNPCHLGNESMKRRWQKDESARNFIRDDKRMILFLGWTNDDNLQQIKIADYEE